MSVMNEKIKSLESQINQQQNRKLEEIFNVQFKTHLQEVNSSLFLDDFLERSNYLA